MLSKMIPESVHRLTQIGISEADAFQLRRIAMTLHRWHELECGTDAGYIQRTGDEPDGTPYFVTNAPATWDVKRRPIADREAGAKRRLARIMAQYPHLSAYVQTDPRGCALFILDKATTPQPYDQNYSRGVAVYK